MIPKITTAIVTAITETTTIITMVIITVTIMETIITTITAIIRTKRIGLIGSKIYAIKMINHGMILVLIPRISGKTSIAGKLRKPLEYPAVFVVYVVIK